MGQHPVVTNIGVMNICSAADVEMLAAPELTDLYLHCARLQRLVEQVELARALAKAVARETYGDEFKRALRNGS